LAKICDERGCAWVIEQPATSLMLHIPALRRRLRAGLLFQSVFDWCMYKRPWKKSTALQGRCRWIADMNRRCDRSHKHVVLQGAQRDKEGVWRSRTAIVAEYGADWCEEVARRATQEVQEPSVAKPAISTTLWASLVKGLSRDPGEEAAEIFGCPWKRSRRSGINKDWYL